VKERLLTIFCGVCMLLSFAAIVSWARSTVSSEGVTIGHRYSRVSLMASEGAILIIRGKLIFESEAVERAWRAAIDPDHSIDWNRWRVIWSRDMGLVSLPNGTLLGFGFDSAITDNTRRVMMPGLKWKRTTVQIPHWAIVMLTGVAPGVWLYRRQRVRRSRLSRGLCRKCGFEMGELYHCCPKCGERAPLPEGFPVIETRG
jgi:hypothetical protein